jgi:hypothetical protein
LEPSLTADLIETAEASIVPPTTDSFLIDPIAVKPRIERLDPHLANCRSEKEEPN